MKPRARFAKDGMSYSYYMHYAEGTLMPYLTQLLLFTLLPGRFPFFFRWLVALISKQVIRLFLLPNICSQLDALEEDLEGKTWFCGDKISGADIMMSLPVEAALLREDYGKRKNLRRFISQIKERDAWKQAEEKGGKLDLGHLETPCSTGQHTGNRFVHSVMADADREARLAEAKKKVAVNAMKKKSLKAKTGPVEYATQTESSDRRNVSMDGNAPLEEDNISEIPKPIPEPELETVQDELVPSGTLEGALPSNNQNTIQPVAKTKDQSHRISELEAYISQLQHENHQLHSFEEQTFSLQGKIGEYEDQLSSYEITKNTMHEKLETVTEELSSVQAKLDQKTSSIESLESTLDSLEAQLSQKEKEILSKPDLQPFLDAKSKQIEKMDEVVSNLKAELAEELLGNETANTRLEELSKQLQESQAQIDETHLKNNELQSTIVHLEEQLAQLTVVKTSLEEEITSMKLTLESLQTTSTDEKTIQLTSQLAALQTQHQYLVVRNQEVKQKASSLQIENTGLFKQLAELRQRNIELTNEKVGLAAETDLLTEEAAGLRKALERDSVEDDSATRQKLEQKVRELEGVLYQERSKSHAEQKRQLSSTGDSQQFSPDFSLEITPGHPPTFVISPEMAINLDLTIHGGCPCCVGETFEI
ncbi:hypothetical protein NEOLI_002802 [Neolecta irregularis DAH-3]|uniref:Glutathione S-transferase C-terminal domain-containing protein n=1 Tax=Neolecta irregularis (strain DAH-3) TaxID=1198029 RepID=A0A1U7LQL1_NEOID|nr:hypothetical protein NEOLI_002802 [Neolecta irregularis DAH-3]|eukprot:OLL24919.1 hypothetical protein NEOLI_002802 [Neolecta irregularis DAH-3]